MDGSIGLRISSWSASLPCVVIIASPIFPSRQASKQREVVVVDFARGFGINYLTPEIWSRQSLKRGDKRWMAGGVLRTGFLLIRGLKSLNPFSKACGVNIRTDAHHSFEVSTSLYINAINENLSVRVNFQLLVTSPINPPLLCARMTAHETITTSHWRTSRPKGQYHFRTQQLE